MCVLTSSSSAVGLSVTSRLSEPVTTAAAVAGEGGILEHMQVGGRAGEICGGDLWGGRTRLWVCHLHSDSCQ